MPPTDRPTPSDPEALTLSAEEERRAWRLLASCILLSTEKRKEVEEAISRASRGEKEG